MARLRVGSQLGLGAGTVSCATSSFAPHRWSGLASASGDDTAGMLRADAEYEYRRQAFQIGNLMNPGHGEPWLDQDGNIAWGAARTLVAKVLLSKTADTVLTIIIVANLFLIVYETNREAKCFPEHTSADLEDCPLASFNQPWLRISNNGLLGFYTLEAMACIYALRASYFKHTSHVFNLGVCVAGWFALCLGGYLNLAWLRIFRLGRVLKALHLVNTIPELSKLVDGFSASMKAMFFGALMLLALLCLFSILTVQLIHPVASSLDHETFGCGSFCSMAYSSIPRAMLTIFQNVIAGDSWGIMSNPVILKDVKVGLLLPLTYLVIGVGAMNLILAVVVDAAMDGRESNVARLAAAKAAQQTSRKLELLNMLQEMDANKNGIIERDEIARAANTSVEFQTLLGLAGVQKDELEEIVDSLADSVSQSFGYKEFGTVLHDLESADIRKMVVLIRLHVTRMERTVLDKLTAHDAVLQSISTNLASFKDSHFHCTEHDSKRENMCSQQHQFPDALQTAADDQGDFCKSLVLRSTIAEEMESCRVQIDEETSNLRRCLARLDDCWNDALGVTVDLSVIQDDCGIDGPSTGQSCMALLKEQIAFSGHIQRASQLRRSKLFSDLATGLEDDVSRLVDHCTLWTRVHKILGQDVTPLTLPAFPRHPSPHPSPCTTERQYLTRGARGDSPLETPRITPRILY